MKSHRDTQAINVMSYNNIPSDKGLISLPGRGGTDRMYSLGQMQLAQLNEAMVSQRAHPEG